MQQRYVYLLAAPLTGTGLSVFFVDLITTVLAAARIPSLMVHGFPLAGRQRSAELVTWLEVHDGDRWLYVDPATGDESLPNHPLLAREIAVTIGAQTQCRPDSRRYADVVYQYDLASTRSGNGIVRRAVPDGNYRMTELRRCKEMAQD